MHIAIGLYERFTSLDAMGPFQVLSSLPGAQVTFVAEKAGPVTDESGFLTVNARAAFADLPNPDILLVPGGIITGTLVPDHPIVGWIARAHRTTTWTTSVCTGSLLLAGAGVLAGVEATTHWGAMDDLARLGAVPVRERVVQRGKIVTAAGVSAGIDMALTLVAAIAGTEFAQTLQLMMEYDPAPPFDTGSPDKAGPEAVQRALAAMAEVLMTLAR
ncbi:MAG: DJ-1/PfpI family protein [Deltaproteobacteria bacterium]|nr:DJ-1/PfpI family protein [Deltaproteobacteria bacterium]MBI3391132.1 DJ-1/PfpI family protein [Deltaproteobacteria bacterium]